MSFLYQVKTSRLWSVIFLSINVRLRSQRCVMPAVNRPFLELTICPLMRIIKKQTHPVQKIISSGICKNILSVESFFSQALKRQLMQIQTICE